ncbi:MAG TPA: hypothetical protein VFV34_02430 [Blastocatellia bacterium]|nr:hypothetical protein [Blastocatellia bacterium]
MAVTSRLLCLGITGSLLTLHGGNPTFDGRLTVLLLVMISAALALLGPGAYSLDARPFGRREIIIPGASNEPVLKGGLCRVGLRCVVLGARRWNREQVATTSVGCDGPKGEVD